MRVSLPDCTALTDLRTAQCLFVEVTTMRLILFRDEINKSCGPCLHNQFPSAETLPSVGNRGVLVVDLSSVSCKLYSCHWVSSSIHSHANVRRAR